MSARWRRHGPRTAITLLPVLLALLHATGTLPLPLVDRLDALIGDARLRAALPGTADERIVIVDIDDASLQQFGQWPWSRDKLGQLTAEIMVRQQASVLGFDVLFAEPDGRPHPAAAGDPDIAFARALAGHRVALGFYLTQTPVPRATGHLPPPVLPLAAFPEGRDYATRWNGFGGSIDALAGAAPAAGFLNAVLGAGTDGILRTTPLIARLDAPFAAPGYHESLGLAVYRLATGAPAPTPTFVAGPGGTAPVLQALRLAPVAGPAVRVPVDALAGMRVPYRGPGGAGGGSFRYIPAADLLHGRLGAGALRGRIVLVGASAPGLQDLRATPVSPTYPGVEVHASVVSALLDGRFLSVPDFAPGYDVAVRLLAGSALAVGLSLLAAPGAVLLTLATVAAVVGLNTALYNGAGLVLPLAGALLMIALAFGLNVSWGYLVEGRARRGLARLFGSYVPPELVEEMQRDPARYSMRAQSKELTVLFCDMRGFTALSEELAPAQLQAFLNEVFSQLTRIISAHRGTVDKYMGDCVMAFWGAPVDTPGHATLAVQAALDMAAAIRRIDHARRGSGQGGIGVGIGINTGVMSVGDMGSQLRRSYTVVGDAVNLASRLEGLGSHYGVSIVASDATRQAVPGIGWQELDLVAVKGRAQAVRIHTPLSPQEAVAFQQGGQAERWARFLVAYRTQDWPASDALLASLRQVDAQKVLYRLYDERIASVNLSPRTPDWDGATRFDTK